MQHDREMTLKDWVITMVLLFIPLVNLIMLIIWASEKTNPRNLFAKAYLIVAGAFIALIVIFYVLLFIVIFATFGLN